MAKEMTKEMAKVWTRMRWMLVGSLQHYAEEYECDGELEMAEMLTGIANRLANGTATEEDWLEAVDQCDMSDQ